MIAIEYRKVKWTHSKLLEKNPQEHDLEALMVAIALYGFRDPVAYDTTVDGLVEGNGRTEALLIMEASNQPVPHNIIVDDEGDWCMPVIFGANSATIAEAYRYAIDHNLATLSGGAFSTSDKLKMMDRQILLSICDDINSTIFLDESEVSFLRLQDVQEDGLSFPEEPEAPSEEPETKRVVIKMTLEQHETFTSMMDALMETLETKDKAEVINTCLESYTG